MHKNFRIVLEGLKRAISIEYSKNIKYLVIKMTNNEEFFIKYFLHNIPTEDDLEVLSLIETEIFSYAWRSISKINYKWEVSEKIPKLIKENEFLYILKN